MRTDVIDQILAMALHPAYDCKRAKVLMEMIFDLAQSPETHIYIIQREGLEKMLEICEKRCKMVIKQQSQQKKKEDLMKINILKYVTDLLSHTHTHTHTHTHAHTCTCACMHTHSWS